MAALPVEVAVAAAPEGQARSTQAVLPDPKREAFRSSLLQALDGAGAEATRDSNSAVPTTSAPSPSVAAESNADLAIDETSPHEKLRPRMHTHISDASTNANLEAEAQLATQSGSSASDDGDVERGVQDEASKDKVADASPAQRPRCLRRACTRRVLIPCSLVLVAFALCAFFVWPRDPSWTLTKLNIDFVAFMEVVAAASNGDAVAPVAMSAEVDVWNPNFIGTHTEVGEFKVLYGSEVMGYGTTSSSDVHPRSTVKMTVDIYIAFTQSVAHKVLSDMYDNNMELDVGVDVVTPVKLGSMNAKALTLCTVHAEAVRLFEHPEQVVTRRHCTYGYGM